MPVLLQNSLRHSLSLGHYFRKYNSDKLVTKKGHLWEVDPQRSAELDKEMYMFLARGMPGNLYEVLKNKSHDFTEGKCPLLHDHFQKMCPLRLSYLNYDYK